MDTIIGRDPNGLIRQLSVIGSEDGKIGLIITRLPIQATDIIHTITTSAAFAIGLRQWASPALPAGYMYYMQLISGRWYNGTANNIRLGFQPGGNKYIASDNTLPLGTPLIASNPIWLKAGDNIFIEANVTVAGTNLELTWSWIRSPIP